MNRTAVCSWSLRPESVSDLIDKCRRCGVSAVQLWLDPVRQWQWRPDEVGSRLRAAGITIVSGMMAPKGEDYSTLESIKATGGVRVDSVWEDNLKAAEGCCIVAQRFGLSLVTLHAGYMPSKAGDPERAKIIGRLKQIAEVFAARNIRIAFETGQETAAGMISALDELNEQLPDRARVGVNFDPANMILYGSGEPIAALKQMMPHVRQVHIKEAVPTAKPGTWGEEKPAGKGAVDWAAFFRTLKDAGYHGDFVIEREGGDDRVADVVLARELIAKHTG